MSTDLKWQNIDHDIASSQTDEELRSILQTLVVHIKDLEVQAGLLAPKPEGKKPNPWQFGPHTLPDFKGSPKSFGNTEEAPK